MQIFCVLTIAALLSWAANDVTTGVVSTGVVREAQSTGDEDEVWTDEDDGVTGEDDGAIEEPDLYWAIPEDERPDDWTDEPELPIDVDVLLMVSAEGRSGDERPPQC